MNVVIAMDSFKGSLTSFEAGKAVREGLLKAIPKANVHICPMADGGEGTVYALCEGANGRIVEKTVTDPLGNQILSYYGILEDGTAVIEVAAAAGLTLIPIGKRNPLFTTTYGVGELILDAVEKGCRDFIIGLGGSGTNDGGVGMLSALGWRFFDEDGNSIPMGAIGLRTLHSIDATLVLSALKECRFRIACDVKNPLLGETGCSAVYGPQKGASPIMVQDMNAWLEAYSNIVKQLYPAADPNSPGVGAAGGLGFAFSAFLNGKLEPGAQIVSNLYRLADFIQDSDFVITGEGRLDGQTAMGKAPIRIAQMGKKYGKPVIAFAGAIGPDAGKTMEEGITAYFPIVPRAMTTEEAMESNTAFVNLKNAVFQVFSLISNL